MCYSLNVPPFVFSLFYLNKFSIAIHFYFCRSRYLLHLSILFANISWNGIFSPRLSSYISLISSQGQIKKKAEKTFFSLFSEKFSTFFAKLKRGLILFVFSTHFVKSFFITFIRHKYKTFNFPQLHLLTSLVNHGNLIIIRHWFNFSH